MKCNYTPENLYKLVNKQINNYWPHDDNDFFDSFNKSLDKSEIIWGNNYNYPISIRSSFDKSLDRTELNFKLRNSNTFNYNGEAKFNIFHSVQYSIFLYIYSNQLYKDGFITEASKVYYLNKIMNSVDWFYEVEMPTHFGAEHPLGSVVGRATLGDFLFLYQGTTIGGNIKNNKIYYPSIGDNVTLFSNSKVLGNSIIGNNVILAANSCVLDENIPDNSLVFGMSPNLVIKKDYGDKIEQIIKHIWLK